MPYWVKFTVLSVSSYFVVYFFKLELILFYNRVVYYYTRILLVWLPRPISSSSSSSSSYRAASTDISDLLSLPISIVFGSREVFTALSWISTELLYISSSWSSCLCSPMWRGPQEYVTYKFVPTSPAISRMSGSSNLDSFRDEW